MSRFNTKSTGTKTTNLAGGAAYSQTSELELVSILLTSFLKDKFYEKDTTTLERIKNLISLCNKKFVAQAAVYARVIYGMRSVTHVVASELAKYIGKESWAKDFYNAIIHRPDDITEILSYHLSKNGKISNAMKKGLALSFNKFNNYQLAKYRGEGNSLKLVDAANILHPVPIESNREALEGLIKGTLKSLDTWESGLTKAGQVATNDEELKGLKKEVWINLIREKKLGYFALLRNLRNIIEQAPEIVDEALVLLVNEKLIKTSLVLPFRFTTAYEQITAMSQLHSSSIRKVLVALNKAVDIAVNNVPVFDGDTLVVLDISGSMQGKPSQIGALFSAVLLKSNNADFMTFDDDAKFINYNPADSTITIANGLRFQGGGTNFHSIFETAKKKYDRIIILSDMQGWIGRHSPAQTSFIDYKRRTGANPFIYSFDLNGYGSMQFPERNVFAIAGFSEKVFDIMKYMEADKDALLNIIKDQSF